VTLGLLVLTALVVVLAAFVQGATGVGFALVVAPVVGTFAPQLLPASLLVLMIPLNLYVAWHERHALDRSGALWITAGRTFGTLGGLLLLTTVPGGALNVLIGGATVLAALATLLAPSFEPGPRAFVVAGAVTGVTETATGIGGPPLALVYQHRPAAILRSTVALCFVVGETISLVILFAAGRVTPEHFRVAFLLIPGLALGAVLSRIVHHRLNGRLLRAFVLIFAVVSGTVVLLRG
jgi:uncharacterized membrane protein YfcA